MDKKTLTGLLVIGAILLGFSWYTSHQQSKEAQRKAAADSLYLVQHPVTAGSDSLHMSGDSTAVAFGAAGQKQEVADSVLKGHIGGMLFAATKGAEEFYTLENDKVKLTLSSLGGRVASVELKDYKNYNGRPLVLFDADSSRFDAQFFIKNLYGDTQINTGSYYFSTTSLPQTSIAEQDSVSVVMRLPIDSVSCVQYTYTLHKGDYMVNLRMDFVAMNDKLSNQSDMTIDWGMISNQQEKGYSNENNYTDLQYMLPGERSTEKLGMSKGHKDGSVTSKVHWVAFKQQFFSSVLVADGAFSGASLSYDTEPEGSGHIKRYDAKMTVPLTTGSTGCNFKFYFGPNKYTVLNKYDEHFERLVPLGWGIFGWINRWVVIPVFDFLSGGIANFGLIILLLTIFIKILISPLTYKSYLSTAKMRLLKPEIDEINGKFPQKEDALKKQQATMALYKKAGVSPMGGCIPMLIQFPILIAMFRFFPASIELRGQSFLWADDLSSYDSILNLSFNIPFYGAHVSLFALLMAASMYMVTRISSAQTMSAGPQMAGMKFMSLYMMPVMMLMWFNSYASGLSYYYLLSNLITIGQTYLFRYAVNDEKLHAEMKANAKKPQRKKSKWSERYEQMVKDQQRQQKTVQQQREQKKSTRGK